MTGPTTWATVTPESPCVICGKSDWCAASADGSIAICRRVSDGAISQKIDRSGSVYWVHATLVADGTDRSGRHFEKFPTRNVTRLSSALLHAVYSEMLAQLPLEAGHRQNLLRRGLNDDQIVRGEYRSLAKGQHSSLASALVERFGPDVAAHVPGIYVHRRWSDWRLCSASGLLVPVRNHAGEIVAIKVRRDAADTGPRYVYISSVKRGGTSPGAPIHVPVFTASDRATCRITEGELKADVATALSGMLTISIPGVNAWRAVLPVLRAMNVKNVRLAFDADYRTNPHVADALSACASTLAREGF